MGNKNINRVAIPLVLIVGVFIGGVVVLRTKGIGAAILSEGKKVFVSVADDPEADPDNDGLKNWQEKIYKTDARNSDTDGDGYLDGEEIGSGYDPAIPSPNDALEGTNTSQPRPLPKNLTTYLAQILTQKISSGEIAPATGDQLNNPSDPNLPANQEILQEALNQISVKAKRDFALPEISDNEIIISQSPTNYEEIGAYITAMSQALIPDESVAGFKQSEVEIIKDAIENKDTGKVELLLTSLRKSLENLKRVTAPKDFADIHKQQISILALNAKILEAVKNFQDDPAGAAAAVQVYPQTIDMLQKLSEDLYARIEKYQNSPTK